jgi:putative transposase
VDSAILIKADGLCSQKGYRRRPWHFTGKPTNVSPDDSALCLMPIQNEDGVTDITYICADERWLYLAATFELFSRPIVSLSMQGRIDQKFVFSMLLWEIWRRKPS